MIEIRNRLRIYEGNILMIMGCEPISVVTHISNYQYNPDVTTLTNHFNEICPSSFITLAKAMEAIPEATVYYGHDRASRWFILPDGPPPSDTCPCRQMSDWYAILRANADSPILTDSQKKEITADCSAFSWRTCL